MLLGLFWLHLSFANRMCHKTLRHIIDPINFQLPKLENIFYTVSWKHEVGSVNENSKVSHWTSKKVEFMETEKVILKKGNKT